MRTIFRLLIVSFLLILFLIGTGCSYYHTRYFMRNDRSEVLIGQYRLTPRVFACQEKKVLPDEVACEDYVVTIRVEDSQVDNDKSGWQQDQVMVDSMAQVFALRVADVFAADSLLLHQVDGGERIKLVPDSDRLSPRRENYYTLHFDQIQTPLRIIQLRVVLHVNRSDVSGLSLADSVVWLMDPVDTEEYGLMMFRDNVRGYD